MFGIVFEEGGVQIRFSTMILAVKRIFFMKKNISKVINQYIRRPKPAYF